MGYDLAMHFKPIVPPSEHGQATAAGTLASLMNAASFFDYKTKSFQTIPGSVDKVLSLPFVANNPILKRKVQSALTEAQRGTFGSRHMVGILDELMQSSSVDKNGPGGYNTAQEAFLTAVAYTQKYWVSVPGQSGLNVSAGDVINVKYPVNSNKLLTKRLFIPRLIHEIRFTRGPDREPVTNQAVTEIYGVAWGS
jgi:hypothetical protein